MPTHTFFVEGIPSPGGSKSFMGISRKTGRAILVDAGGLKTKEWRKSVEEAAWDFMSSRPPFRGPIKCDFVFYMPRRKFHLNKNGTLKNRAPKYHLTKPDALKLARSTEDAMTEIVWVDDAQIVNGSQIKVFADKRKPGAKITITENSKKYENDRID